MNFHSRPHPSLTTLLALLIVGLSSLVACGGKIAYTNQLRAQHTLTAKDVRGIQFYLSDGLRFYRIVGADGKTVSLDPTLVRNDSHTFEEIEIKAGTPGVVLWVDRNKLAVSFEKGSYLMFTSVQVPEYGEPQKDSFTEKYAIHRLLHTAKPSTILYTCATYSKECKQSYHLTLRDGYDKAHLVFPPEELDKLKRKRRVQKGRRVE